MRIMDLSIIIVNWNTPDLLAQCLESLKSELEVLPNLTTETVVVDNASTDESVKLIREQFPWVTLIENQNNVGFAAANNQAVHQSSGRYVFLLNPDTELKPGALAPLIEFLDSHPQAGAAGSRLLNPNETLQTSCYPALTLSRELWRLFHLDKFHAYGVYHMKKWDTDARREVDVLQGASLLLRRKALDQVGVLDDDYFMYTEEVDLCYRLQKGGWQLFWVPQSQVVHYGGQSTQQVATKMFLWLYQSKLIFFRKHYGRIGAFVYKLILLLATLIRLILSPLIWLEPLPRRRRHLTLAGQYRQLLWQLPRM